MLPDNVKTIPEWKLKWGRELLTTLQAKKMSLEEFEDEVAKMEAAVLDCMAYKLLPTEPEIFTVYMSEKHSSDFTARNNARKREKEVLSAPIVWQYLDEKEKTIHENLKNLLWLKHYLKCYERMKMIKEIEKCNELIMGHTQEHEETITLNEAEQRYGT